MTTKQVEKF